MLTDAQLYAIVELLMQVMAGVQKPFSVSVDDLCKELNIPAESYGPYSLIVLQTFAESANLLVSAPKGLTGYATVDRHLFVAPMLTLPTLYPKLTKKG